MEDKIKVVLVEPNKKATVAEIDRSVEGMQAVVGGLIQAICPFEEEVAIVCNEEAKLMHLLPNRAVRMDGDDEIFDIICGTFFVVGCSGQNFESLSEDQVRKYQRKYLFPERFFKINKKIQAVPYETFCEEK